MAAAETGANRRRAKRIRWRLQVAFDHDPSRRAFTTNISQTGVGVCSDYVALPGSEVNGKVVLPDGARIPFTAMVRWAKKVRREATLGGTNAMGLEFVTPIGAEYLAFIEGAPQVLVEQGVSQLASLPSVAAPPRTGAATPAGSEQPGSAAPDPFSPVDWPISPVDQSARLLVVVEARDLAVASRRAPGGLDASRAAEWCAEASKRCIATLLPPKVDSVVVGISLSLSHHPAVEVGSKLVTDVRVVRLTARGRTVAFEATVSQGDRQVATGSVARLLVDRSTFVP